MQCLSSRALMTAESLDRPTLGDVTLTGAEHSEFYAGNLFMAPEWPTEAFSAWRGRNKPLPFYLASVTRIIPAESKSFRTFLRGYLHPSREQSGELGLFAYFQGGGGPR